MRARPLPRGIKPVPPLPVIAPSFTEIDASDRDSSRFAWWIETVGEARANVAMAIYRERTGSRTLPELLAEDWLRRQAADYIAQLDLGYAKPDFAVFSAPAAPGGALLLRIHGDHWHGTPGAMTRDQSQRTMLENETARGVPVLKIIDVWESAIYANDAALELAYYQGSELPRQGVK